MINRQEYLNELLSWKDEQIIKVVTGIRRCGKSVLLKLYQEKLKEMGVLDEQIIYINFEDLDTEGLPNYKKLYDFIVKKLCKDKFTYIFLDEIQKVMDFQKAVDSLYIKDNVDIYITGSNAYLLSSELATLLSGRYVEIKMLPLSFKEYYEINNDIPKEQAFSNFLRNGGMPYIARMEGQSKKMSQYLEGIYNTIILKDVEERQKRKDKEKRKTVDITLLKSIANYLANVVGIPVSVKSIADYLTSNNRKVSPHTVSDYVEMLTECFLFYPANRYDIQGKEELKSNQKYYIVDLGIRNYLISKETSDLGYSLENLVYLELLRRDYKVSVGKLGTKEVDFIAEKKGVKEYFQVSANLTDENTFNREIAPLKAIKDNYPKKIITMDIYSVGNYAGIEVVSIIDWLFGLVH